VGTDIYGDPSDPTQPYSVRFGDMDYDKVLIAEGSFTNWVIFEN
jgi:hypothetical protein